MTMSQSKGLTADTAIVLGVEEGVIPMPPPKGGTEEEERRLLYVAMTRARQVCILTYAVQRHGAMAMRGEPNFGARRRSPLIAALPIGQLEDGPAFIAGLPR